MLKNKPFEGVTNLEKLYLISNKMAHLDSKPFEGLTRLADINLKGNQLVHLDNKPFEGLKNLEKLYLTSNKFKTVMFVLKSHGRRLSFCLSFSMSKVGNITQYHIIGVIVPGISVKKGRCAYKCAQSLCTRLMWMGEAV